MSDSLTAPSGLNRFAVKRALRRDKCRHGWNPDSVPEIHVMAEVAEDIKQLGDKIVELTLKQAVDLASYLKDTYDIEPAAGGAVMMAPGGPAAAAPVEEAKSTFDVVLKSGGDKKIQVIKVVRAATQLGLKEAKDLVEGAPKVVKENLPKEEAEKLKKEIEDQGGVVELK